MALGWASFRQNECGAAAVEMALMLPMLMALLFAGMEGSYYFWSEHRVVKAVRDGARYAGRQSFDQYSCSTASTVAATATNIKNLTRTGTLDGTGAPLIPGWADTQTAITVAACNSATATGLFLTQANGAVRVTVSADVPYQSLFSSLGISTATLRLRASQQAVVMGL